MIDLETFMKSLKNTSIKRFMGSDANGILSKIYMKNLHPIGGKFLFECNYSKNDVDVFAGTNSFLKDVFTSWASCNSKQVILSYRNESKKISNDQELIQSDPISCPQNQKGNN